MNEFKQPEHYTSKYDHVVYFKKRNVIDSKCMNTKKNTTQETYRYTMCLHFVFYLLYSVSCVIVDGYFTREFVHVLPYLHYT